MPKKEYKKEIKEEMLFPLLMKKDGAEKYAANEEIKKTLEDMGWK